MISPFAETAVASSSEVAKKFETDIQNGLTSAQATTRLLTYGRNTLAGSEPSTWDLIVRQFRSVFVWLLIFAAALSFILHQRLDGTLIVVFVLLNVFLTFFQEYKSQHILATLKKYFVAHSRVIRDGKQEEIMSPQLVLGDVVVLEPGDLVPADVRLFEAVDFTLDESVLTGESQAVEKSADDLSTPPQNLFAAQNIAFAATHVVSGTGRGIVIATASHTQAGSAAKLATQTKRVSNFEQVMDQFSVFMLRLVIGTLLVLFVLHYVIKGPTVQIGELLIFFIALAVSVVPEALPVVFTFALSNGAAHLARHKVVVKRLTSIEDLGNIDILCTDKTGTITQGEMVLVEVSDGDGHTLQIARVGIPESDARENPFDKAIAKAEGSMSAQIVEVVDRIGFDPTQRFDLTLVKNPKPMLIMRGAPESVAEHCAMSVEQKAQMTKWIEQEGRKGRRVLAVAQRFFETIPDNWSQPDGLLFLGMLSFEDPLKPTSLAAVKKAQALGLSIKVLTGDRPEVAGAIATQVGLIKDPDEVMTGEQLFALPADQQLNAARRCHVFARVTPEDKLEIIRLLKEHARVGFLGEGINDAPALKEAHVGIVVESASDVARESADIVLLQQSLMVILEGVERGRIVSANTLKYIKTTLASNFGNFYSVAIASLFIPYLPMLPIQILLVNLLSDFPMIAISTDTVEASALSKPRGMDLREMGFVTTFFGVISSVFDFILFGAFFRTSAALLQTAWFIESILTELFAILSLRTHKWFFLTRPPARLLSSLIIGATIVTLALPLWSVTRGLFSFAAISRPQLLSVIGIIAAYFVAMEISKKLFYRYVHD